VEVVVLVAIRCAGCASIFYICTSHYRGHIYCQLRCRSDAARSAKARHQGSRLGRRDHASHNAAYRERQRANGVRLQKVRYSPAKELADESFSCVRDLEAPCMTQGRARAPRSTEYAHYKASSPAHADHAVRCIVCARTGSFMHSAAAVTSRALQRSRGGRTRTRIRSVVVQRE
jgi:hypothetical protein